MERLGGGRFGFGGGRRGSRSPQRSPQRCKAWHADRHRLCHSLSAAAQWWAQAGFVPLHVGLYARRSRTEQPRITTAVAKALHLPQDRAKEVAEFWLRVA